MRVLLNQFLKMKRIYCSTRVTKTGIDTMIVIRKYPAYPVNPVKNEKKHHCFIKLYEFVDFDIMPLEVDYDCY